MKAVERELLSVLSDNTIRFVVPVYQRNYAWEKKEWEQLWNDILQIAKSPEKEHFTGSIVWVGKLQGPGKDNEGNVLVDGQQRLTTLSLIILALADSLKKLDENGNNPELAISYKKLVHRGYLLSTVEKGEQRYKLTLSEPDKAIFRALVERLVEPDHPLPDNAATSRIFKALEFFKQKISELNNPNLLWDGLKRLNIVNVTLEPGKDNPQLVFESMNAKGKELKDADKIRNYLLLGLPFDEQTKLYDNYWRQIELLLDTETSEDRFDTFIFHYLTITQAPKTVIKKHLYEEFKEYKEKSKLTANELLQDLLFHANIYRKISDLDKDDHPELAESFHTINMIKADPVLPLIMFLYKQQINRPDQVSMNELIQAVKILESFIVYRTLCDLPSNALSKFIPLLIAGLSEEVNQDKFNITKKLLASLESGKGTSREYPSSEKVIEVLKKRNFYSMMGSRPKFFLEKIENSRHPHNKYDLSKFTIEHVMPKTIDPSTDWPQMLGSDYEKSYKEYLHLLGNLTLTSFNSELGNMSFRDKKIKFKETFETNSMSLLADIQKVEKWNFGYIKERSEKLAQTLINLWPKMSITEKEIDIFSLIQARDRTEQNYTSLKDYMDFGVLQEGEELVIPETSMYSGICHLTKDGFMEFADGTIKDSPTGAVKHIMKMKGLPIKTTNGWQTWVVPRLGVKLNELERFINH